MGCRTLQPILNDPCSGNQGGIRTTVWIGEKDNIEITKTYHDQQAEDYVTAITVAKKSTVTGPAVTKYQFRKQISGLTSEMTVDDPNGVFFVTSNLDLVFAKQEATKRMSMMSLFLNGNMFAIVQDQNGNYHFLGLDNPVTATAGGAQTGVASTDANQYNVTLSDISNELPFVWEESVGDDIVAALESDTTSGNGE